MIPDSVIVQIIKVRYLSEIHPFRVYALLESQVFQASTASSVTRPITPPESLQFGYTDLIQVSLGLNLHLFPPGVLHKVTLGHQRHLRVRSTTIFIFLLLTAFQFFREVLLCVHLCFPLIPIPGNVLKEICDPAGAVIRASQFQLADPTISLLELWGAEYQESDAMLVRHEDSAILAKIGIREKCPVSFVGAISGTGKVGLGVFKK